MFNDLLEPDYGINQDPVDDTMITQILLYLDNKDVEEFKIRSKRLMKKYWPHSYREEANLSDLLLKLLRDADTQTEATSL